MAKGLCCGDVYCCWAKKSQKKSKKSNNKDIKAFAKFSNDERVKSADKGLNPPVVVSKGYVVKSQIGEGGFSHVYSAENLKENDPKKKAIAAKIVTFNDVSKDWKDSQLKNETKISRKVNNENVIKNIEIIQTGHRAFIFMERADGQLESYIMKKFGSNIVPEKNAKSFFKQIVSAISYLHGFGVAHRGKYTN